jgi:CRISPR-associated protein Csb2
MMLLLGIRYLNGWAMATHPTDRGKPEWPPHPDRVFMALAAAHFETNGDAAERQLLEWLETLAPPQVLCGQASRERDTVTTFVPVNDTGDPVKKGRPLMPAGSLPLGRDRQPRQFPVTIPDDPFVFLAWEDATPTETQSKSLGELAAKVTYLGHSASLVQMWVADDLPPTYGSEGHSQHWQLQPSDTDRPRFRLRVFGPGRLAGLEARFNGAAVEEFASLCSAIAGSKGRKKKELQQQLKDRFAGVEPQTLRPTPGLWLGYDLKRLPKPEPTSGRSHFQEDLIVLRQTGGRRVGLESTLLLTEALRNAAMRASPQQPPPEWLTGHEPKGEPSRRECGHVAFLPLAHVGRQNADGRLLGLAIAVPRDVPPGELACLNPLLFDERGSPREITLTLGRSGQCVLKLDEEADYRTSLNRETWTASLRPSERWGSVTPIAFDRHAKSKSPWSDIEVVVANGCERIGLPRPREVIPTPVSMFPGAPAARQMPRLVRKSDGGLIRHTHAILIFPEPIVGPVLIGAGRYRGYGLCRPLREPQEDTV